MDNERFVERERQENLDEEYLKGCVKVLAANIMRVFRGAGKPYAITGQLTDVLDAVGEYQDSHNSGVPPWVYESALCEERQRPYDMGLNADERERASARDTIVDGAMQVAASDLLGQRAQSSAGHSQMTLGFSMINDLNRQMKLRQGAW